LSLKPGAGKGIDPSVLERAEQAVAAMADSYLEWAARDVGRLQAALAEARQQPGDLAPIQLLREIAHEVRGQGGSFGFPLVSRIATSMYRLLRERATFPTAALSLIDAHIDALRAVLAQRARGDGGSTGQQLAAGLEAMVERMLAETPAPA
jgi:chemotaxis protein histidine kinase CheA